MNRKQKGELLLDNLIVAVAKSIKQYSFVCNDQQLIYNSIERNLRKKYFSEHEARAIIIIASGNCNEDELLIHKNVLSDFIKKHS